MSALGEIGADVESSMHSVALTSDGYLTPFKVRLRSFHVRPRLAIGLTTIPILKHAV
jgi:hypothetical protein